MSPLSNGFNQIDIWDSLWVIFYLIDIGWPHPIYMVLSLGRKVALGCIIKLDKYIRASGPIRNISLQSLLQFLNSGSGLAFLS